MPGSSGSVQDRFGLGGSNCIRELLATWARAPLCFFPVRFTLMFLKYYIKTYQERAYLIYQPLLGGAPFLPADSCGQIPTVLFE